MNNKLKKLFGLMALVLALSACGSGSNEKESAKEEPKETTTSEEALKPEDRSKDELVLGLGFEPEKGFNPIFESSHSQSNIFHASLLKRDLDLNIVEDLAESYELSEDKKTYIVKLKDGLKFADGSDLTAEDLSLIHISEPTRRPG